MGFSKGNFGERTRKLMEKIADEITKRNLLFLTFLIRNILLVYVFFLSIFLLLNFLTEDIKIIDLDAEKFSPSSVRIF